MLNHTSPTHIRIIGKPSDILIRRNESLFPHIGLCLTRMSSSQHSGGRPFVISGEAVNYKQICIWPAHLPHITTTAATDMTSWHVVKLCIELLPTNWVTGTTHRDWPFTPSPPPPRLHLKDTWARGGIECGEEVSQHVAGVTVDGVTDEKCLIGHHQQTSMSGISITHCPQWTNEDERGRKRSPGFTSRPITHPP